MDAPVEVLEGFIPFRGHRTWYRVVGSLENAGSVPLLALHGGPGFPHDYLEPLERLAQAGRAVVFYDQLDCGRSDGPEDPSLWRLDVFLEELATVRRELGLRRLYLLGHSWGGMLALEYTLTRPDGLVGLVLASTIATNLGHEARRRRVYEWLPPEVRNTLIRHWDAGTTDDPAYQEAYQVFSRLHVNRLAVEPDCLRRSGIGLNSTIAKVMWEGGTNGAIGLKHWDVTTRLAQIEVPTLVLVGRLDGLVYEQDEVLCTGIPNCERVVFEHSAHWPHLEEPERYLAVLRDFLARTEHREGLD